MVSVSPSCLGLCLSLWVSSLSLSLSSLCFCPWVSLGRLFGYLFSPVSVNYCESLPQGLRSHILNLSLTITLRSAPPLSCWFLPGPGTLQQLQTMSMCSPHSVPSPGSPPGSPPGFSARYSETQQDLSCSPEEARPARNRWGWAGRMPQGHSKEPKDRQTMAFQPLVSYNIA